MFAKLKSQVFVGACSLACLAYLAGANALDLVMPASEPASEDDE